MGSLRQWWIAGRPLTARQHLIAIVCWQVVAGVVTYQLLADVTDAL